MACGELHTATPTGMWLGSVAPPQNRRMTRQRLIILELPLFDLRSGRRRLHAIFSWLEPFTSHLFN